jgi:hypothetical protein
MPQILVERRLNIPIIDGLPLDFLREIQRRANILNKLCDVCLVTSKDSVVDFVWYTVDQMRDTNILTTETMASVTEKMKPGDVITVVMLLPGKLARVSYFSARKFRDEDLSILG